ncbi:MAG: nucleoside recognition domain-containing protein [Crocinitomicaceae bacterium]|nr:nucleoside recognition domain-containing protein [Crocinitomicaceae bacterium]MDG1777297.1 nucleoside recognition domain-containing protein [Crocinitomicaceae bacterium]
MLLNRIWIGMFLISMVVALSKLIFWQDVDIFKNLVDSLFSAADTGFTLSLSLTGVLCFWMGIMKIGENGGAIKHLTRFVSPLFSRIFPEVPKDHPANGAMMMNFSANMLGLDNSATPLGLKAMKELQSLNPEKDRASNAQIMFLVLNTSGLTIIPVSIFALRAGAESSSPTAVFLPILITTFISSLFGLIFVSIRQKINLLQPTILAYLGSISVLIGVLLYYVVNNPQNTDVISNIAGNFIIFSVIIAFMLLAWRNKVNVYESFIDGAKEGFGVAISIIPYLVAMLAAIAVFRASGSLNVITDGIKELAMLLGVTMLEWVDALPVAFMKPLSGGGARGAYVEVMNNFGIDSIQEKIAATMQGSTETTFYVLAVYFGSVNIKNTRYAAGAGLLCDLVGIVAAIIISYLFYTNG